MRRPTTIMLVPVNSCDQERTRKHRPLLVLLVGLQFRGARTWRPQGSQSPGHEDVDTDPRVTPSRHRLGLHRASLDPGKPADA